MEKIETKDITHLDILCISVILITPILYLILLIGLMYLNVIEKTIISIIILLIIYLYGYYVLLYKIKLKYYFTREKLVHLLASNDKDFYEHDFDFLDDNAIIQMAGREGWIKNVDKNKMYCFDNGNIVEQKKLERWLA